MYSSGSVSIDLGTFTETQYTAGKTCGTVELKVIDSAGSIATQTVTVKPRPVEDLMAVRNDKHHTLTWDFPEENMAYIEKFEIQENPDGNGFTTLGFVLPSEQNPRQYNDDNTRPQPISYRVIVHAGQVNSNYVEVVSY